MTPFRRLTTVLPAALLLTLAACAPEAPPADLAIQNVTVVDAVDGAREGRTVLVRDGRIAGVVDASQAVEATRVVDGTGRYLIPGLWDFHVHLTYDDRFTEAMPALFLKHGITSIRDTGGMLDRVEAMEAEGATAPRVFFAGPLLDGEKVVYDGVNRPALGIANPDPEAARANVARLAEAGVDFIKIYELVTPEVFDALVAAGEERGLPRDGHVPLSMLARDVGPHVQSLEHLRNIEMDCAADADELLAARRDILAAGTQTETPGADIRAELHELHRLPSVAAYDEARCDAVLASLTGTIQVPTLRLNALGVRGPWERDDWDDALALAPAEAADAWAAETAGMGGDGPARDTVFGNYEAPSELAAGPKTPGPP